MNKKILLISHIVFVAWTYASQFDVGQLSLHPQSIHAQTQFDTMYSEKSHDQQYLLNLQDPQIHNLILDATIDSRAPAIVPVQINNHITLSQLIVAWEVFYMPLSKVSTHGLPKATKIINLTKQYYPDFIEQIEQQYKDTPKIFKDRIINIGGGRESSGYHAIKNILIAARSFYASTMEEQIDIISTVLNVKLGGALFGLPTQNEFIFDVKKPGIWRQLKIDTQSIMDQFFYHISLKPLLPANEETISLIWSQDNVNDIASFFPPDQVYKFTHLLYDKKDKILLSSNYQKNSFIQIQQAFRKSKNGIFAFIIDSPNRWYSLVINKVNESYKQCIIMDSANISRYQDPQIINIIASLCDIKADDIRAQVMRFRVGHYVL